MELSHVALLWLAAFAGGFTQGLAGFGSTLVALPILALVLDLKVAVPVCTTLAVTLNIVMIVRLRGHVRRGLLVLLIASSLPAMPFGAYILRVVSGDWLKLALAVAILVFVVVQGRPGAQASTAGLGRGWGVLAGLVAGGMGGAIGINGPPIVAWMSRLGLPRDALRATLVSYFFLAGCGVVASQAGAGLVTGAVLGRTGLALPALGAGIFAGMKLCGRVSEAAFRRIILAILAFNAVMLLAQGLAGLIGR
ncbi:MAG: putative permease [Solidesulfovibrio magneticus str. Maddingley MBC34]|uniref:Probable membrane transporter protein n=1 Tax=Solidesulfovibrio magneticus str. Maddingley MBC34 TaxID=1206767 RepID=K6H8I2_9BACT|nr:MAG: putative permease [Solidesulfovibrio magneticus str. Maddingley MBC34]